MSDYSGNGELVLGSFKTIRAFRARDGFYQSITYSNMYQPGIVYVAECKLVQWDTRKIMDLLGITQEMRGAAVINKVSCLGSHWEIEVEGIEGLWDSLFEPRHRRRLSSWSVACGRRRDTFTISHQTMLQHCLTSHTGAPVRGCRCGFYSFYDIPTMLEKGRAYITTPEMFDFGVVENYGKVIHCDLGLRSEKMKILGVASFSEIFDLVKRFPLDVFDASAYLSSTPES